MRSGDIAVGALIVVFLAGCSGPPAPPAGGGGPPKPRISRGVLADNTLCYVCHLTLQTEEVTTIHQKVGMGCTECHGISSDHMHDEMLMTPADIKFGRREVEGMCRQCHDPLHVLAGDKVKAFLEKWRGKDRPNGRIITEQSVCTDCHGTHNIVKEMGSKKKDEKPPEWIQLFNGKDLAGWKPSGGAEWKVKLGRIAGSGAGGGILWTEDEWGDYQLAVTYRSEGPAAAGLLLRGRDAEPGPRVEIVRGGANAGSVTLPAGGAVLLNTRDDLVDAEGWNTLSIEAVGKRVRVWLNGAEIGAVQVPLPATGRIGIQLSGGELSVREAQIQKLAPPAEKR